MKKFFCMLLCAFTTFSSQAQTDSLDLMIGQMIMIGIGDFSQMDNTQPIFRDIERGLVGGVVLYEKNIFFHDPKKALAKLVTGLQKEAPIPVFVGIDEEGGYVNRLKPKYGFPKGRSQAYLGKVNNLDSTRFYAIQTSRMLASFGINMNYAPVVDVNVNSQNPIIGKLQRSYSADAKQVTKHAQSAIQAHLTSEVIPVLKHFPGHGSSKNDTHLGVVDVSNTWQEAELLPYTMLLYSDMVKAIMTAHIVNKSLDTELLPSTLSKKVITDLLRDSLKFEGVVISDDMQMGAIRNAFGIKESIRLSIEAGVDILMFANNVQNSQRVSASQIHQIIKDLVLKGQIKQKRIEQSFRRIILLKHEFGLLENSFKKDLEKRLKAFY